MTNLESTTENREECSKEKWKSGFLYLREAKAKRHETSLPKGPKEHANASWDQCTFVVSHLVLCEDVTVGHTVVNQPNSNKKLL